MSARVPGPGLTMVAALVLGLAVALAAPALVEHDEGEDPGHSPPAAERLEPPGGGEAFGRGDRDDPLAPSEESPEDALLRDSLGGLASLVLPAGPDIEACARPHGAVPEPPAGADPVDAITLQVQALRGLELEEPVEVRLLDAAAMVEEVQERFAGRGRPERIDLEQRVLSALGAIPPGTDLARLRVAAFAEQVSGVHASGDGLILLRADDPPHLGPLARTVLVHELEHAVTFEQLGRPGDHRDGEEHADQRRASLAVVEGTATLAMLQYARSVLDADERDILRAELLARAREDALTDYTPYLLAELRFPYTEGLRFVCARWRAGGWAAADATYTDPPETSAEILFPERYGDEPESPRALGELDPPWDRARTTTFGAAELLWLLEAPGGGPDAALADARRRAAEWDGGRLVVWTDGPRTALGIALVDRGEGPDLCGTVRDWYAASLPDSIATDGGEHMTFAHDRQDAVVACADGQVRLGIAPGLEDALGLVE